MHDAVFVVVLVVVSVVVVVVTAVLLSVVYLYLTCPHTTQRAESTMTYMCAGWQRRVPRMHFPSPAPYMLTPDTLTAQTFYVRRALGFLERHDITYWMCCGSLIGAVRHAGFIPWDDDTDVQVPIEHEDRLLTLQPLMRAEGMVLVPAGGGFKLCRDNVLAYPFVDLIFVGKRFPSSPRLELAYPRDRRKTRALTFRKARQWPKECFLERDVFPLVRVPFESFHVYVPNRAVQLICDMYGPDVLTQAAKGTPRLRNHKSLMFLRKLRLVPLFHT
jgi:hypothetical protein